MFISKLSAATNTTTTTTQSMHDSDCITIFFVDFFLTSELPIHIHTNHYFPNFLILFFFFFFFCKTNHTRKQTPYTLPMRVQFASNLVWNNRSKLKILLRILSSVDNSDSILIYRYSLSPSFLVLSTNSRLTCNFSVTTKNMHASIVPPWQNHTSLHLSHCTSIPGTSIYHRDS